MLSPAYLRTVPLPQDLTNDDIFTALVETESFFTLIRNNAGINLSEIIQANNFSGVVSNVFTKKTGRREHLSALSRSALS